MAILLRTPFVLVDDADLVRVSRDNPGYRFEREEDGSVIVSPTHTKGGAKSLEAAAQLWLYARRMGGKAYDSSTGFAIGPGSRVYSPDAAWVSKARIDALSPEEADGFWPLSPDVVIEIRSDTDLFRDTIAKTKVFMERGSTYAVAIDPLTREITIFGEAPPGLALDFDAIADA